MDVKDLLTEREWEFLQARLSGDEDALETFGNDVDLLSRSVDAKIAEAKKETAVFIPDVPDEPVEQAVSTMDALGAVPATQVEMTDLRVGERVLYKAACAIFRVKGIKRDSTGKAVEVTLSSGAGRATIVTDRESVARVRSGSSRKRRINASGPFKSGGGQAF